MRTSLKLSATMLRLLKTQLSYNHFQITLFSLSSKRSLYRKLWVKFFRINVLEQVLYGVIILKTFLSFYFDTVTSLYYCKNITKKLFCSQTPQE